MSGWRERWAGMTLRERRLIVVMLALFAVVILWFGIIRPVNDGLARARADHAIALDRNARVAGLVAVLKGGGGSAPVALDGALDQVVGQSATEAGFTLESANLEGADRMTIAIGSARAPALFAWLAGLQARGIGIETLIVQPAANGTVGARATLRVAR